MAEVRAPAARLGLRTADKPESMDVCFITKGARVAFLGARRPLRGGAIVDTEGTAVGAHRGISAFTIGQRRGLGVAAGERRYVVDIDASTATVTIGPREGLLRDEVTLRGVSFVGASPGPGLLHAQVRAHGEPVPAQLVGRVVRFVEPQPRVAPGQVVALYEGDTLLGGGIAE
jgi:tRNA-specific 2-thiouridylase